MDKFRFPVSPAKLCKLTDVSHWKKTCTCFLWRQCWLLLSRSGFLSDLKRDGRAFVLTQREQYHWQAHVFDKHPGQYYWCTPTGDCNDRQDPLLLRHWGYIFSQVSTTSARRWVIVHDIAVVPGSKKIQQNHCQYLTKPKSTAVKYLQEGSERTTVSGYSELLLAKITNKQSDGQKNRSSRYIILQFLLPSYNHCENSIS